MPHSTLSRPILTRVGYTLLIVTCLTLVGLMISVHAHFRRDATALLPIAQAAPVPPAVTAQNQRQAPRGDVERITIRPTGFEPTEITRPAGPLLLAVDNSSGLAEVQLRLAREHGAQLHEVRVSRHGRNWRQPIEFTPGSYLLTEANHPDWVCHITITN
jgi:hypothetical protein